MCRTDAHLNQRRNLTLHAFLSPRFGARVKAADSCSGAQNRSCSRTTSDSGIKSPLPPPTTASATAHTTTTTLTTTLTTTAAATIAAMTVTGFSHSCSSSSDTQSLYRTRTGWRQVVQSERQSRPAGWRLDSKIQLYGVQLYSALL
ncbi:hypothetical protein EXIGLDRAFT_477647 [Exidia glandulosa HHB12029]|uniref:Uncharacterized protein n=1 Tax=Exidia glandulosa HHB12029 TaxID=1314781 RepID=A0A166NJA6_EXIGL|nr:hypothetical protein EXIGLDRAFT_477647 [Exidia glandulosa HHB12029]